MPEVVSTMKAIEGAIASAWARGSLLLWGLATVCMALAGTLRLCAYWELQKAAALWAEYGLALILMSVGFAILAAFKTYGERVKPNLSLIANERQSFWGHAAQADGSIITQLSLRFQATNMGDTTIQLSGIKLNRPWVRHKSIIDELLMTEHPTGDMYGSRNPIMPHALTEASATIIIKGAVGGVGKRGTMRVSISVQDHAGRWHKLAFSHLRNPAAPE
jgi:hypothetical protein